MIDSNNNKFSCNFVSRREETKAITEIKDLRKKIFLLFLREEEPLTPKYIKETLQVESYSKLSYHLNRLVHDGVIFPVNVNDQQRHFIIQPCFLPTLTEEIKETFLSFLQALSSSVYLCFSATPSGKCEDCSQEERQAALQRITSIFVKYIFNEYALSFKKENEKLEELPTSNDS